MPQPNNSREEQRDQRRIRVDEPATIKHQKGSERGLVRDISATGAQLVLDEPPEPDSTIEIKMDAVGPILEGRVRWRAGNRVGAAFERISADAVEKIRKL
jgi:hypothetical protein